MMANDEMTPASDDNGPTYDEKWSKFESARENPKSKLTSGR